ncbi:MAG: hypothetical protein KC425_10295 [Anaerolineales bacterium]|nr:hypothetical protein [Anaerolineales bacterium]
MDLFEATNHSFVIRIWLEKATGPANQSVWRGHVTHVMSGNRRYFEDVQEVLLFVQAYLNEKSTSKSSG